jgi:DNA polymerase-1
MAMVTIHQRLKEEGLKAQMIMQVHDELNFNVPENEVDRVREIVVSEMQNVVHLTVPLIADCGVGENWLQAH